MKIILNSFKDSFKLIKKHKYIIILIFFLQLLFFSLFAINMTTTMTPALQATKDVLTYVNQLKMDEEALTQGLLTNKSMFGDDPLLIYNNYNIIMNFLKWFLVIALIIFVIFEGLNWALTVYLSRKKLPKKKKFKMFARFILNFLAVTIGYFLIIGIIIANQLKSIIRTPTLPAYQIVLTLTAVLLLVYFLLISYSLLNNKDLLAIIKKSFLIGIFKAYIILPVLVFNLLLIALASFLLFKAAEANLFLVILSVILFTFSFIFARILFVRLIHKIDG